MEYKQILKEIEECEVLLIGAGSDLSYLKDRKTKEVSEEWEENSRLYHMLSTGETERSGQLKKYMQAYEILYRIAKEKDYFILTTNTDAIIYYSGLKKERIAAPCGDIRRMQCENTEHGVWDIRENMEAAYRAGFQNKELPRCPVCGKTGSFNTILHKPYAEEGYLHDWEIYNKWLKRTLNRRLLILELGENFDMPGVMRWPFERIAFINQKAKLLRVNPRFPQLDEELAEKGCAIRQEVFPFLHEIFKLLK